LLLVVAVVLVVMVAHPKLALAVVVQVVIKQALQLLTPILFM
jgi:hypothetical protein